jgi:hypothetical protein
MDSFSTTVKCVCREGKLAPHFILNYFLTKNEMYTQTYCSVKSTELTFLKIDVFLTGAIVRDFS